MRSTMTLLTLVSGLALSAFAHALPYKNEITGELAKAIYVLAEDSSSPGVPGPRTFDLSCAYEKASDTFKLLLCICDDGYINPPLNQQISDFLLSNRTPDHMDHNNYVISARALCTADGEVYRCKFEDQ